ncbi:DNA methyltransferase [Parasediminibacterium paludis]|uniref:site-specific DNA-methyltransferase (adenine-specific) n=1 Tax=Parasediminibacterium paludis TaxID=908966 RepID=A0ABV8PTA6_9BACT
MQDVLEQLTTLLSQEKKFVATDGQLLKSSILTATKQLEPHLLTLLLSQPTIKAYFFQKVYDIWVFDTIKFQQYINNELFYKDNEIETAFKPREKLIIPTNHPTTKIVFKGFKKYAISGSYIPDILSAKDNFIIRGNNITVLRSLQTMYRNRIKLIYIDPPYNTGSDVFLYNDTFNSSTWLTFMKNRLLIAWQLLASDGSIFIQVDDTEFAYLKVLCDEIFGRDNFKEHIVLKSSTESGVNAINVKRGERLFKVKEHILFYAKSPSFRFKPFYVKASFNTHYKYEVKQTNNSLTIEDINKTITEKYLQGKKKKTLTDIELHSIKLAVETYALQHATNIYSLERNIKKAGKKFKAFAAANKAKGIVEIFETTNKQIALVYDGGMLIPLQERLVIENGKTYFGVLASDLWVDISTTTASEGGVSFNNGKKPEKLLKRIIEMATEPGDIVLDYYLGSGTTAAVAHKLNRRYIGIEQLNYGDNDSLVRLQNVIHGDDTGISKTINWQGGGSFIYCELQQTNQLWAEQIAKVTTKKRTTALIKQLISNPTIFADANELAQKQTQQTFLNLDLALQKKILLQLLESDDSIYTLSGAIQLSPQELKLNQQFYDMLP